MIKLSANFNEKWISQQFPVFEVSPQDSMVELKIADHAYDTEFLCLGLVQYPRKIILRDAKVFLHEINAKLFRIVNLPFPVGKVFKLPPAITIKGHAAFRVAKAE
jgi:hypothetical protein